MKFTFILSILSLFIFKSVAQPVKISGKVIDSKSKKYLAGASIRMGDKKTITDKLGVFDLAVTPNIYTKEDLIVSYISYRDTIVYRPDAGTFLLLPLQSTEHELTEVIISAKNGIGIIKKAIANIPKNYPLFATNTYNFQNLHIRGNEDEYIMYDTALIKTFVPPYDFNEEIQLMTLQNSRIEYKKDTTKKFNDTKNAYNTSAKCDFAHNRTSIADVKAIEKYNFTLRGIIPYKGRPTYVIDFARKKNKAGYDGTVLIDSSTYAFTRYVYSANQKLRKKKEFFDGYKDYFLIAQIDYTYWDGLWYLTRYTGEQYQRLFNILTMRSDRYSITLNISVIAIDSANASSINKLDQIPQNSNTKDIKKFVPRAQWEKIYPYISLKEDEINTTEGGSFLPTAFFVEWPERTLCL